MNTPWIGQERTEAGCSGHQEIEFAGTGGVSISRFMGIPIVEFSIDNCSCKIIFRGTPEPNYRIWSETITRTMKLQALDRRFLPGGSRPILGTECFYDTYTTLDC